MAAAGRDPAQLLDVDVHQLAARLIALVASDDPPGRPVHPVQTV